MEAICKGGGSGSTWRGRGYNFATILTDFSGGFSSHFHDFNTTIGPRSGFDHGPRSPSIFVGSSRSDFAAEGVRSRRDLGSIAARSDCDRGDLPCMVCAVR